MAHLSELFLLIYLHGFLKVYSREIRSKSIGAFENEQVCLVVNKVPEMQTITLFKNESPVLSWGENKAILATEYKNRINSIDRTDQLEFCILNISRDDAGKYIWKNKDGKNQSIFLLNVWFGPTDIWITPNMSESMNQSSSLKINCRAVCNPDCDFIWVKNQDIRISNSSILFVGNISKMDRGTYKCTAVNVENNNYNISTEFEINVNYAASINLTVSAYKEVTEYSTINITCNVSSYPISNVSLHSEKRELNTIIREQNKAVFNLFNSTCDDSGMYTCSAFNGIGIKDTKNVTVEVLCKPRFVGTYTGHNIKKRVSASIGYEFNMNFTIKAHPKPNLLFNSSDIDINFTTVSDYKYDVMMRKRISTEFDFQETLIIIGNSQGNVTIAMKVEKRKRKFAIAYGIMFGVVASILTLLSVSILIFAVLRRVKHQKENLSLGNPEAIYVNADFEAAESISEITFDEAYVFQNRVREIELTATECYENLAVTGGTTDYEEMKVKTDSEVEDSQTSDRSSDENSFDEAYVFQNRVREIELTATESYENLAVTGGTTEYEDMDGNTVTGAVESI